MNMHTHVSLYNHLQVINKMKPPRTDTFPAHRVTLTKVELAGLSICKTQECYPITEYIIIVKKQYF